VPSRRAETLDRRVRAAAQRANRYLREERPIAFFVGLFVFAFALRLTYLFQVGDTAFFKFPVGDSVTYDRWALDIQKDWVGHEVFYQAPLYPYFLAVLYSVVGHSLWAVRVVQAALGSAACVLLALAGRTFFSPIVAAVAGVLLAVYAPAIFFDGLVHKASLDLFLMTTLLLSLAMVEKDRTARWPVFWTGVALGALALTRENALVLVPVLVAWMGTRSPSGKLDRALGSRIACFFVGIGLVLSPVLARNYAVGREVFVTTSQFGANFYGGNNEQADGTYEPLRWGHGEYPQEREDAFNIAADALGHKPTAKEVSNYWSSRAWAWIRSHPGDWLKLLGRKLLLVWNAYEIPDSDDPLVYEDASPLLSALGHVFFFGTLCPLALVGVFATRSDWRRLSALYLVVLGIAASTTLFFVFARYRYPMVPVLALFAAAGLRELVRLARSRQPRALALNAALLGAAALLVGWKFDGVDRSRSIAYYNLAVSLERQGETSGAAASYQVALKEAPDLVQAHVNLGALLASQGQFEEGIAHEKAALKLRPNDAIAHTDLGNALLELGRMEEAEGHYRAALEIQPDLVQALDGLSAVEGARGAPK
jgi:tetratricopeptide (TPR) repeat protein